MTGPLVVSFWGSLGAREMNKMIARFMARNAQDNQPFQHIHSTGSYGWKWMPDYVKEQGVDLEHTPAIDMREFIYDMPTVMAAADLVICRAGAATIAEVAAAGKPAIFVPSPNVTDNHQEKNARIIEHGGGAVVLRESECSGDILYDTAKGLLDDPQKLEGMGRQPKHWRCRIPQSASEHYDGAHEIKRKDWRRRHGHGFIPADPVDGTGADSPPGRKCWWQWLWCCCFPWYFSG